MNTDDVIELYTVKFDKTVRYKTSKLNIVVSATRGTVEDLNEAMNVMAKALRAAFPVPDGSETA